MLNNLAKYVYKDIYPCKVGVEFETGQAIHYIGPTSLGFDLKEDQSVPGECEYVTPIIDSVEEVAKLLDGIAYIDALDSVCKIHYSLLGEEYYKYGTRNSIHVHVSGYEHTREFINALYILFYNIQGELFGIANIFNPYGGDVGIKSDNWCKMVPLLHGDLIHMPYGQLSSILINRLRGLYCGKYYENNSIKNTKFFSRYFALNLSNILDGIRKYKKTVEFRLYPLVPRARVMLTYVLLSVYIYKYAYHRSTYILNHLNKGKIRLDEIIDFACSNYLKKIVIDTVEYLRDETPKRSLKAICNEVQK